MSEHEQAARQRRLRDRSLEWLEIEGEIIALDMQASVYLRANASGAVLWAALAQGATEDALVDQLSGRYGLGRDQAAADVRAFVTTLESHSLLAP